MNHHFNFAVFAVVALTSVGCSSGSTGQTPSDAGSSSKANKTPAAGGDTDGGGTGGPTSGGDDLGPSCTAYLACCDKLTASSAASCDAVRSAIQQAIEKGVTVETYESGCRSGLDALTSAGSCK